MGWLDGIRQRARALKAETYVLYLAARHPRTPWYAKLLVAVVVAYAFSPLDLIPDFIPVLGLLDDLVLIPLGLLLALRLVPPQVLAECRARAQERRRIVSRAAAVFVVLVWLALAALGGWWLWGYFSPAA
ncbi:MAG: DUF1232 domain-containing protein [Curvibacter sp.]